MLTFFKHHKKELYEHLAVVAAHGASLYLGGLHALDGLVKADALNAWAAQVPPDEYNQKASAPMSARSRLELLLIALKTEFSADAVCALGP